MANIKSFKQYVKDTREIGVEKSVKGDYILNTVFGKHSEKPDSNKIGILNTTFGKHSKITDVKESYKDLPHSNPDTYNSPEVVKDLHHKLSAHHDDYTDEDVKAIKTHTQSSFPLNNSMHERAMGNDYKQHENEKPMMDVVHRHVTPSDMTVYSGVRHSPEHLIKHQKGDKNGKGGEAKTTHFTSTSISRGRANAFAMSDDNSKYNKGLAEHEHMSHVLKMHIPKGHPAAYVDQHSEHEGEKELILPPNTHMHIHHEPTIEHTQHGHHVVWHVNVLPYKGK